MKLTDTQRRIGNWVLICLLVFTAVLIQVGAVYVPFNEHTEIQCDTHGNCNMRLYSAQKYMKCDGELRPVEAPQVRLEKNALVITACGMNQTYNVTILTTDKPVAINDKTVTAALDVTQLNLSTKFDVRLDKTPLDTHGMEFVEVIQLDDRNISKNTEYPWKIDWTDAVQQGLTVEKTDIGVKITNMRAVDGKMTLDPVVNITGDTDYVRDVFVSQFSPDSNYGSSGDLDLRTSTTSYQVYMGFNLTHIPGPKVSDILKLRCKDTKGDAISIFNASCNYDFESTITWNNKAATCTDTSAAIETITCTSGVWNEINITKYLNANKIGYIHLYTTTSSSDFASWNSTESGSYIEITYTAYPTDPLYLYNGVNVTFVDINNSLCSDAYTRATALNPYTPWCQMDGVLATSSSGRAKINCGDTVYMKQGNYNTNTPLYWRMTTNCSAALNTTITPYPGDRVNITDYYEDIANHTTTWTNISASYPGQNIWRVTKTVSRRETQVYYSPYEKLNTNKCFNTDSNCTDTCSTGTCNYLTEAARTYPGSYADTLSATKYEYIKLRTGESPNVIPIYVADDYGPVYIVDYTGPGYLILQNMTFQLANHPITIQKAGHIVIQNNVFVGGFNSIDIEDTSSTLGNGYGAYIDIHHNEFIGSWRFNESWFQILVKQTKEEADSIHLRYGDGPNFIHDNNFYNNTGGITFSDENQTYDECGDQIYNNHFYNGTSSQLELENKGCNLSIYNNTITGGFGGVSFGPLYCRSTSPCRFYNNFVNLSQNITYDTGVIQSSYAIKFYNWFPPMKHNNSHINISNNHLEGGQAIYFIYDSWPNTWYNTTLFNNIFRGRADYAVKGTDRASQGNWFDYNYLWGASALYARYLNNTNPNTKYTLAETYSDVNYLGWDTHSLTANLVYTGLFTGSTYTPTWNSSGVDAGTDVVSTFRSTDAYGNPIYGAPDIGPVEYQPPYTFTTLLYNASPRVYADGRWRPTTASTQLLNISLAPISGWGTYASNSIPRPVFADLTTAYVNHTHTAYNLTLTEPTTINLQVWPNATGARVYINGSYANKSISLNGSGWGSYNSNGTTGNYSFKGFNRVIFQGATNKTTFYMDQYNQSSSSNFELLQVNYSGWHLRNYDNFTASMQVNFSFVGYNYTCEDFTALYYESDTGAYKYTLLDGGSDVACFNSSNTILANLTGIEPASGSNSITLNFVPLGVATIAVNPIYETDRNEFGLYVNTALYNISYVEFVHNGTLYDTTTTSVSSITWFNVSVYAPIIGEDASASIFFYWNVYYLNGSIEQTHIYNYTTIQLWFDNCSRGPTEAVKYFSYDELHPETALNTDIEFVADYYYADRGLMKNYSMNMSGLNNYTFCIYPNNISVYVDAYLKYNTTGGFVHRHYLSNESVSNATKNVSIYDVTDITGFSTLVLTVRDKNSYNYFDDGVVSLQKYYVGENVWRTVQMGYTGAYGNLPFDIIEKTADYRFMMHDTHSHLLETSGTLQFTCTDLRCDLTYLILPYNDLTTLNITVWHLYDNNTGIVHVYWKGNGYNKTINTIVTLQSGSKTRTICDSNSSAIFGQSVCDISGSAGLYQVQVIVYGSVISKYSTIIERARAAISDMISQTEGSFWAFGIILTIAAVGFFSPVGAIIGTVIGMMTLSFFGILSGITFMAMVGVVVVAIIVGLKIKN